MYWLHDANTSLNNCGYSNANQSISYHECPNCEKSYTYKKNLQRHLRYECGIVPQQKCPHCSYITRYKHSLKTHIASQHQQPPNFERFDDLLQKTNWISGLFFSINIWRKKLIIFFWNSCVNVINFFKKFKINFEVLKNEFSMLNQINVL